MPKQVLLVKRSQSARFKAFVFLHVVAPKALRAFGRHRLGADQFQERIGLLRLSTILTAISRPLWAAAVSSRVSKPCGWTVRLLRGLGSEVP
ncbi:hypothetical protein ACFSOZ_22030 [Mesorhizobium newzealandense]|uniref:Uncharacterized protein n=1 Tax=Mesorhizobium newzealandense TaxID=1300302 RepID=A0ABW4UGB1_9HYPH